MESYPSILDELERGPPRELSSVGGGCIAQAAIAKFSDGSRVFVKRHAGDPEMFECEAAGLQELASAGAIRVPEVLAVSEVALVLECITQGGQAPGFFANFGRQFAQLHRHHGESFGFHQDNFLGSTPQPNSSTEDNWPAFFMEHRLRYQVELAHSNGFGNGLVSLLDRGEAAILELLDEDRQPPSLLHGDLWGGNFLTDEKGDPCLIDPAVYYGHREADLAMTRLFGGFGPDFYSAYDEAWPLAAGWEERLNLYQLYHLLNHLNLFGSAYYDRSRQILERYAG